MKSGAVPFLCSGPSRHWLPCKVAFGKNQRAEVTQRLKEMLALALSLGRISTDLRAGHGVPHTAGQQLSCPRHLLCYVF